MFKYFYINIIKFYLRFFLKKISLQYDKNIVNFISVKIIKILRINLND
jgi:hypothetical protein